MAKRTAVIAALRTAIQSGGLTYQALELKTVPEVRALLGEADTGLSASFVENMQKRAVKKMRQAELQSIANWLVSRASAQYPNISVVPKKGRTLMVYLDGLVEEEV